MQAADSGWATHTTPDGREYYFHKGLNKTTWDKPDELKNADEKDAPTGSASDWKEFTTDAGKKYYFNATTKVTTWTMPEELKASAAAPAPAAAPAAPAAVEQFASPVPAADADENSEERRQFVEMLESTAGLAPELSWEEAMRLIINNPTYRVLKTLAERKAAHAKWREDKLTAAEEERRRTERQRKVDFVSMLKECTELTSRTRFQKVLSLFAADPYAPRHTPPHTYTPYMPICSAATRV